MSIVSVNHMDKLIWIMLLNLSKLQTVNLEKNWDLKSWTQTHTLISSTNDDPQGQ